MKILQKKLSYLNEGEVVATVPFPRAKSFGDKFDCDYLRLPSPDSPSRWSFVKRGVKTIDKFVFLPGVYQGETLASQSQVHGHYLNHLFAGTLVHQPDESFLYLRPSKGSTLEAYIASGASNVTSGVDLENHKTAWKRFIDDYLFPFVSSRVNCSSQDFRQFLRGLAYSSGQIYQPSRIARSCAELPGFDSANKVVRAVDLLAQFGVWSFMAPHFSRPTGNQPSAKKPVGYFFDASFLVYLMRRRAYIYEGNELMRNLFWHFVVNDLKRHLDHRHPDVQMEHYIRSRFKDPVVLLRKEDKLFPLLVSYDQKRPFKRLERFANATNKVVVVKSSKFRAKADGRILVPFDLAIR